MDKVWMLSRCDYDGTTVIGIYSTSEKAESERERLENLQRNYDSSQTRLSHTRRELRENTALTIQEYILDETLATVIVRMRKDQTVTETLVLLGDRFHGTERIYDGRAGTYEEALRLAQEERKNDVQLTK